MEVVVPLRLRDVRLSILSMLKGGSWRRERKKEMSQRRVQKGWRSPVILYNQNHLCCANYL